MLVRDIQTELNCIVQEEKNFFLPLHEVFVRLHKRAYYKYRLNEIERQWMNMQQNAFKHKKKGVMTEEDNIFFEIVSTSIDYRKNRSSTSRPSSASTITSSIHEYDESSRISIDSDIKYFCFYFTIFLAKQRILTTFRDWINFMILSFLISQIELHGGRFKGFRGQNYFLVYFDF